MNDKKDNWYSSIRFTRSETVAIMKVLKHSQDFGQGVAPGDTVESIIIKIQNQDKKKL